MAIQGISGVSGAGGGTGGGNTGGTGGGAGGANNGPGNTIQRGNIGPAQPETLAQIQAIDTEQDTTPVIPAGAYDYGSGKVYTAFTVEDVVEGNTQRVTMGYGVGMLVN